MKTLKFRNRIHSGEVTVPEPIMHDGKWWEFLEYRKAKNEHGLTGAENNLYILDNLTSWKEVWIASEIPEPTPDQLAAIGMRCPDRPVECKEGDRIWTNAVGATWVCPTDVNLIGHYRFVLEPVEKQPAPPVDILQRLKNYNPPDRTIDVQRQIATDIQDAICEIETLRSYAKPPKAEQPAEDKSTEQAEAWEAVFKLCCDLGMKTDSREIHTGLGLVCDFIVRAVTQMKPPEQPAEKDICINCVCHGHCAQEITGRSMCPFDGTKEQPAPPKYEIPLGNHVVLDAHNDELEIKRIYTSKDKKTIIETNGEQPDEQPAQPKEVRTSCEGCQYAGFGTLPDGTIVHVRTWGNPKCDTCFPETEFKMERKNYTPKAKAEQPAPPKEVHTSCVGCERASINPLLNPSCKPCLDWTISSDGQIRKNYTPKAEQPAQILGDCKNPFLKWKLFDEWWVRQDVCEISPTDIAKMAWERAWIMRGRAEVEQPAEERMSIDAIPIVVLDAHNDVLAVRRIYMDKSQMFIETDAHKEI